MSAVMTKSEREIIDDLIAWRMRKPYLVLATSAHDPFDREWLKKYISKRWVEINGESSPKGPLPVSVEASIDSKLKAQHLATAYNAVVYSAYHRISPRATPVFDIAALHEGYSFYLSALHGKPLIAVDKVYRALMDAHEYRKCKDNGSTWSGSIPVYCSNRRTCELHGNLFLYSPQKATMNVCPYCGHAPILDDSYCGTQLWPEHV